MQVRLAADAAEFLEATEALRAADPVRTNVLGSVAAGVLAGMRYDAESWFVAERDGEVVGAGLWTVPYRLLVGPTDDDVAQAIGAAAARRSEDLGLPLPGVVGDVRAAERAADGVGRPWTTTMSERLLVLHDYLPPAPVAGAVRRPRAQDQELIRAWRRDFAAEAGVLFHDDDAALRRALHVTWLWDVEGTPVSMAGHAPVVSTPAGDVARIGPVYTAPGHRGRGYGGAVTAAVVEHLLPLVRTVMLFTDAANPTSNHVYEALGFVHEADVVELGFEPA
jgi:RimJ/RimL family protein N-acetyltransferase